MLTQEIADHYRGGQAKIFSQADYDYLQGEITDIKAGEYALVIDFAWLAKKDDPFQQKGSWTNFDENLRLAAQLSFFTVRKDEGGSITLSSSIVDQLIVLLPPSHGGSLDPTQVIGLGVEKNQKN